MSRISEINGFTLQELREALNLQGTYLEEIPDDILIDTIGRRDYQRYEYIGDKIYYIAILELMPTQDYTAGLITKVNNSLASNEGMRCLMTARGIDKFVRVTNNKSLADAMESLIGGMYVWLRSTKHSSEAIDIITEWLSSTWKLADLISEVIEDMRAANELGMKQSSVCDLIRWYTTGGVAKPKCDENMQRVTYNAITRERNVEDCSLDLYYDPVLSLKCVDGYYNQHYVCKNLDECVDVVKPFLPCTRDIMEYGEFSRLSRDNMRNVLEDEILYAQSIGINTDHVLSHLKKGYNASNMLKAKRILTDMIKKQLGKQQ